MTPVDRQPPDCVFTTVGMMGSSDCTAMDCIGTEGEVPCQLT